MSDSLAEDSALYHYGLVGLGVMGRNLALNIADHGYRVAGWNRASDLPAESHLTEMFVAAGSPQHQLMATTSLAKFVASLERPRKIIVLIKAGHPVDELIEQLVPLLEEGDLIVDGGNSRPNDTELRSVALKARGIRFFGMGISGGEEGARHGPSLMPGGSADGYAELQPMLEKIAAKVEDGPCVTHVGDGAAGHFVKMVHNGIEYADMQLIAEAYDLLTVAAGFDAAQISAVFAAFNQGPLESYLCEITADLLSKTDDQTGQPLIDVILDLAQQKGTGRWTVEFALELGVPIPTIQAAVTARGLSAQKDQRVVAAKALCGPTNRPSIGAETEFIAALQDALYASKICSYAQGLDLLSTASELNGWNLDFTEIARIWKGGCIIRARFLSAIQAAYRRDRSLPNLLLDPTIQDFLHAAQARWRQVVADCAAHGVPSLALGGSLAYFDSFRRERLPQNLTQAQRDYFGAHTYQRIDRPRSESFHTEW